MKQETWMILERNLMFFSGKVRTNPILDCGNRLIPELKQLLEKITLLVDTLQGIAVDIKKFSRKGEVNEYSETNYGCDAVG